MLQNAYLDAKIGVDPAKNEPPKEWWCRGARLRQGHEGEAERAGGRGRRVAGDVRGEPSAASLREPTAWVVKSC